MELNTEPEEPDSAENENTLETPEHDIHAGDIVQHFKREWVSPDTSEYLYKVLAVAHHTENGEKLMIYQALYAPFKICARPYDMFMSEVDRDNIRILNRSTDLKNILKNKKFWKIICIGYKFSCFYGTDFFYWKVIIVRKLLFRETFRKEIFQINYRKENIMRIINTKFIFKLVLLFFILLFLSPKPLKQE